MSARSLVPYLLVAFFSLAIPAGTTARDLADEELGFNSRVANARIGWLTERAFSPRDRDASLIVNGVPVYYHRPSRTIVNDRFEGEFDVALARARANAQTDPRSLSVILEGAACYYRKMNQAAQSLELLKELVFLMRSRRSESDDLCNALVACAQSAAADHQYSFAESSLLEALEIRRRLHGQDDTSVAEITEQLSSIYYDLNRLDLVARYRKQSIRCVGLQLIAEQEANATRPSWHTWPDIIDSLDTVVTTHDLADAERQADADALAALKRGAPPPPPSKSKKDKSKDKDEEEPPQPYRVSRGGDAR